jgi:LPS-assembly lipoprotein
MVKIFSNYILVLIFIPTLMACGFSPMYGSQSVGQNGSVKSELSQVEIELIPDRSGQFLRNELIDRFYFNGYPTNPKYQLMVQPVKETISDFDITVESEATRQQIRLTTSFILRDTVTNKILLSRNLQAITSSNILESEFSTLITEQSARDAALNDLARQIEQQLALYFSK